MTTSKTIKKEKRKCRCCGAYLNYLDEKAAGKCSFCSMGNVKRSLPKEKPLHKESASEKEEDEGGGFEKTKPKPTPKKVKRKSSF